MAPAVERVHADGEGAVEAARPQLFEGPPKIGDILEPSGVGRDESEEERRPDRRLRDREEEPRVQERLPSGESDPLDAGLSAGPQKFQRGRYRKPGPSPFDSAMGAVEVAFRRGSEQDLARREGFCEGMSRSFGHVIVPGPGGRSATDRAADGLDVFGDRGLEAWIINRGVNLLEDLLGRRAPPGSLGRCPG